MSDMGQETAKKREQWNRMAADFQKVFLLGENDYNRRLYAFWEERQMVRSGFRVLDVGCGPGKNALYFLQQGCDVTLLDLSEEMLKHAKHNLSSFSSGWHTMLCDFHTATGQEKELREGFDFSIATMSGAVHDTKTVQVISALTRGYCFVSHFSDWKQPSRDAVALTAGITPLHMFSRKKPDDRRMIDVIRDAGFTPEYHYEDYDWTDLRTPEEMASHMLRHETVDASGDTEEKLRRLTEAAAAHANADGCVEDHVRTKVIWLYWRS